MSLASQYSGRLKGKLTVVDLRDSKGCPRNWRRFSIEAFQPITHSGLRIAVVPDDV